MKQEERDKLDITALQDALKVLAIINASDKDEIRNKTVKRYAILLCIKHIGDKFTDNDAYPDKLSKAVKEKHSDVPWERLASLRLHLEIHQSYFLHPSTRDKAINCLVDALPHFKLLEQQIKSVLNEISEENYSDARMDVKYNSEGFANNLMTLVEKSPELNIYDHFSISILEIKRLIRLHNINNIHEKVEQNRDYRLSIQNSIDNIVKSIKNSYEKSTYGTKDVRHSKVKTHLNGVFNQHYSQDINMMNFFHFKKIFTTRNEYAHQIDTLFEAKPDLLEYIDNLIKMKPVLEAYYQQAKELLDLKSTSGPVYTWPTLGSLSAGDVKSHSVSSRGYVGKPGKRPPKPEDDAKVTAKKPKLEETEEALQNKGKETITHSLKRK